KGQHIFIEAIKELEAKYSPENLPNFSYLIVGGNVVSYLRYIEHQIEKLELKNVKIYHETREVYDFFCLSDIFVCSSFEESFPRVILEAMAFELKIVSTNVFGIAEMIDNGVEGYLVEAGNPKALADGIYQCLSEPKVAARLASNAYVKVNRKFDLPAQLNRHFLLTKETVVSAGNKPKVD
ncbi:MAG TPA: glycosyltransferase, partial [Phormidium sp.]